MQHELAAGRAGIGADDGCLNADLWTTPALQEEIDIGKKRFAPIYPASILRLSPRAIMDIRPLLSSITRRPQEGPWRRTRLQKCRWNRFSIRPFRPANLGRLLFL